MNIKSFFQKVSSQIVKNIHTIDKWLERTIWVACVLLLVNLYVDSTLFGDIATGLLVLVIIPRIIAIIIKSRTKSNINKDQK